jgi:hypothetical protein
VALSKMGFLVCGPGLQLSQHRASISSGNFELLVVGMSRPSDGPGAAQQLITEKIQLLEICGGFGPIWTAKIIEAIDGCVPVGSVSYGPEAIVPMYELFKD